jgi:hypothetical protein
MVVMMVVATVPVLDNSLGCHSNPVHVEKLRISVKIQPKLEHY